MIFTLQLKLLVLLLIIYCILLIVHTIDWYLRSLYKT